MYFWDESFKEHGEYKVVDFGEYRQYWSLTLKKNSGKTKGHKPNMPKTRPLKAQSTLVVKLRPWVPAIYKAQIGSIRCRIPAPVSVSVSWVVEFKAL